MYRIDQESPTGEVCVEVKGASDGEDVIFWVNLDQLKLES